MSPPRNHPSPVSIAVLGAYLVGIMLAIVAIATALLSLPGAWGWKARAYNYINYTTVPGFFLQDDPSTDPKTFDYTTVNFGLINRTYPSDSQWLGYGGKSTQWQRFAAYVDSLNRQSGADVTYKVLFMARHGEGWHNAAESYYGTPAWNCYWAELDGNGTSIWSDSSLTSNGIAQAVKANRFWAAGITTQGIPAPESYYTSPLTRCLLTANITFGNLTSVLPRSRPFVPTIKEFFREGISIHTCDRRSNRTYIHGLVPRWQFEPDFAETDPLWNGVTGESATAEAARSKVVLDEVFTEDESTWISVTSHSGQIASLLSVLGHRTFGLSTGQAIPVLVRAEKVYQRYPNTVSAWTYEATCTAPPVTSLATGGCVCAGATATATATAAG